jgi:hypothetical protein
MGGLEPTEDLLRLEEIRVFQQEERKKGPDSGEVIYLWRDKQD